MVAVIVLDTVAHGCLSSYLYLRERVKDMYESFISKEVSLRINDLSVNPYIIVSPGVGSFSNGVFKGRIGDYRAIVMHELSELITRELPSGGMNRCIEIHLDLTHGINFMPALTYAVLRDVASILSVFTEVRLVTYNSEPYTPNSKSLEVHIVEDLSRFPWPRYSVINHKELLLKSPSLSSEERAQVDKEVKDVIGDIDLLYRLMCLVASIQYGLPLITYTHYLEPNTPQKVIKGLLNMYLRYVEVGCENGLLVANRRLGLGSSFYELIKALLTTSLLKKSLGIKRETEVSINELKELNKKLFKHNQVIKTKISKDLYEIEKKASSIQEPGWVSYERLHPQGTIDIRNFISHSGLLAKHIEVRRGSASGATYLRFKSDERCIKELLNLCKNSLRSTA